MSGQRYANQLPTPEAQPSNQIVPTAGQMAQRRTVIPSRKGLEIKSTSQFTVSAIGLQVVGEPTEDEHAAFGETLFLAERGFQWISGDYVVYGSDRSWGAYKRLAAQFGIEWRRLEDYAYVCRNVPFSVRTEKLSFTHHRVIAPLFDSDNPDASMEMQQRALDYAIEHGLSVDALKLEVKKVLDDDDVAPPALPAPMWQRSISKTEQALFKKWDRMEDGEKQQAIEFIESFLAKIKALK